MSNLLLEDEQASDAEGAVLEEVGRLLDLIDAARGRWILVSNEVGQGIVPTSPLGREYRDVLGRANLLVASRADKAYLMVAGLALELKSLAGSSPGPDWRERSPIRPGHLGREVWVVRTVRRAPSGCRVVGIVRWSPGWMGCLGT